MEESRAVARAAARMEVARVAFARAATMTAEAVAEVLPLADEPMSAALNEHTCTLPNLILDPRVGSLVRNSTSPSSGEF